MGRDENVSKMDVDSVDSVDRRRPTSTRRALWSTSTGRKRQDGRRRRVENVRMVAFLLVDVDHLLLVVVDGLLLVQVLVDVDQLKTSVVDVDQLKTSG